jgi:hypothetical protein
MTVSISAGHEAVQLEDTNSSRDRRSAALVGVSPALEIPKSDNYLKRSSSWINAGHESMNRRPFPGLSVQAGV